MRKILCTILFLSFSTSTLAEISVIVHKGNTNSFNKNVISNIFLGKIKTFPDGSVAIPIKQEDESINTRFSVEALKKSPSQLKAYWAKLLFTGKGIPPKAVANDIEVLELVNSNPNIIGYIDSNKVTDSVKVIATY
ncbi:phosphate ABC transporter substrate-binding protein [Aliiglaciecola sp. M165]|uniref:phosphate ABC transporter substrate-binding protein n=1 Tax=Aliiglaciecola sp. M165 TaxID=2593649 RepID=UPI00117F1BF9|nr:phosphate ABC transporter substrate-binding protein [Aliiglaciecola sp. M165]TRY31406.1 phosphate ABC transporter substrate-binding protein [Aliiglaciecola sp. M165]